MRLRLLFLLALLQLIDTNDANAWDWLYIQDPRGWNGGQGTIEEAIISVQPRGIYFECGLYLTFSAKNLGFSNTDTVEVDFYFTLPEDAIVHDSWLWIGDEIIQAKILDKWTASQIYEDIVKRRKDPSIMYYHGNGQYELRIFPMVGDERRKIKITYLAPAQWTSSSVLAELPTAMLRTSRSPLSKYHVLSWLHNEWKNPQIVEFPTLSFEQKIDAKYGQYFQLDLPGESIQSYLNFSTDAPLKDGIYLNTYQNGEENIYQLAFLPSDALNMNSSNKAAILFDYDASKSSIQIRDVINTTKSLLHSYFNETDQFNLIFSKLNIDRVSNNWLFADSATIEQTFSQLDETPVSAYSNLPQLLANGIQFVKSNGNDGSILLISNSDQAGNYQVANELIDNMIGLMDGKLPIHVVDFQNQDWTWHYVGGRSYQGNEYFYSNLTRLTSGNYLSLYPDNSIPEILSTAFESLGGFIGSFDIYTTIDNGFCYGRYSFNQNSMTTYLKRPILQIGKFNGSFPFKIEASGLYQSEIFSQQFKIDESFMFLSDSLSEEIWAGNYIHSLESESQTNDIVSEIIYYSLQERILSPYTAFLCLEPQQGGEILINPWDESELVSSVSAINEVEDDTLFQASPNPFNSSTVIKIKLNTNYCANDISFKIYNLLGQSVTSFKSKDLLANQEYEFIWNGQNEFGNEVSSGTYIFMMSTATKRQSLKLLYMK